ncbi:MAG: hypothetical protein AAF721_25285 [Myxococcota bacterium]
MTSRSLSLCLTFGLAACGGDEPGQGDMSGGAGGIVTQGATDGQSVDDDGDTGEKLDLSSADGMPTDDCTPEGEDDFSFIWVSNSEEGTVSKIDTKTGVELGRYFASPAGPEGDPSRTSVNLEGDVVVSVRDPGGISKIAALELNCLDANGDGTIQTSTGPDDVLPWGTDECVLWHTVIPSADQASGPRPTAWDARTVSDPDSGCALADARAWVGYLHEDGHGVFLRLDGETGAILDTVDGPQYINKPYGGAVDAAGNFLVTGWQADPAIVIDGETLAVTDLGNPGVEFYGMALDAAGDLWVADRSDAGAIAHYDRTAQAWSVIADPGGKTRGLMVDEDGQAWVAGNNPCRLVQVDTATETIVNGNIELPSCEQPVGVSIDPDGFVWVVDRGAELAYKVDPVTHDVALTVTGLVGPYTYSDMTGGGLKLVTGTPQG